MSKYTLTFRGKKHEISKQAFFLMVIPVLAFWLGYIWCLCGGVYRFGETYFNSGILLLLTTCIVFGAITINDVRYALLPQNAFTKYLTRILCFVSIAYYMYNVTKYGF